jgi:ribosomal protein S18 acetylase RimI-like enzyme
VRIVRGDEGPALRDLRLRALTTDPEAFGSTFEQELARPGSFWSTWAQLSAQARTQCTFVVDRGGWLDGLAMVRPVGDGRGRAELLAMWVAPEVRGTGLGEELIDAAAHWARKYGSSRLTLQVVETNDRARRAYERAGFTVTGRVTWSNAGRRLHELTMERTL